MQKRIEQGIHTGNGREAMFSQFLHESGNIARVGNQYVGGADLEKGKAIRGERKNMVER